MNRLAVWLDNPILIKHARSRLRRMQVLPSIAVVMIIALSIVLLGYQYDRMGGGGTFGGLMALQSIILAVIGASQVGTSLGKARESGILDFHRASPMTPAAVALGFFFGAPIREYVMFAATLPFSIVCVFMGRPSIGGFFQLMVPLVLSAWVMHGLALFNSLAWNSSKTSTRGVIGLVLLIFFGSGSLYSGFSSAANAVDESPTLGFYWFQLPWLAVLGLDLIPVITFLLVAATRKIASERAHALSKPQAIGGLTTGTVLLVGGLWNVSDFGYWTLVTLYATILGAMVMTVTMTPSRDEFAKGIRRAVKEGRKHPSAWVDQGLNRVGLVCLCAVVLIGSTVVWRAIEEPAPWASQGTTVSYSLSIAIGVLVVAYFGLATQYFLLRFGNRGGVLLALFLFTAWLMPLMLGAIATASAARSYVPGGPPDILSPSLFALSPIAGITLSSGVGEVAGGQAVRAAALVPALTFALLFNNLVTSARRRIERVIEPDTPADKPAPSEVVEEAVGRS